MHQKCLAPANTTAAGYSACPPLRFRIDSPGSPIWYAACISIAGETSLLVDELAGAGLG